MTSIGNQIKTERNKRKISADALGRIIGRDRQMIYKYERDEAEPSGEAMLRLIQHGFVAVPSSGDAA